MATLIIDDVDGELMAALRLRAARHHRSPESEAREILRQVLVADRVRAASGGLGSRIAAMFADTEFPGFPE